MNFQFISKPISIDFIAYHDIQAQVGISTYNILSQCFKCNWKIGPDQQYTGSEAAIMMDHWDFQPNIKKSLIGYKYLFYIPHDLSDIDLYENEKSQLKKCDIIFVPSYLHYNYAKKALGKFPDIIEVGWPKFDILEIPQKYQYFKEKILSLPHKITILYSPTWANTYEWKYLLPLLLKLNCNILIKNHIGVNKNQKFPAGQEKLYTAVLESIEEMENFIIKFDSHKAIVIPRDLNICCLFPYVDLLITDQSSTSLEFATFGISIETGRHNDDSTDLCPSNYLLSENIFFMNKNTLLETFRSDKSLHDFIVEKRIGKKFENINEYRNQLSPVGQKVAGYIDRYLSEYEKMSIFKKIKKKFLLLKEDIPNNLFRQ